MKTHFFPAIKLTFLFIILFIGMYTLAILGIAQFAPNKGSGYVIEANGNTYYENIAQNFYADQYFWSRPSAVNYHAAGSGGSNKGPSNPDYLATVQARIDTFLLRNPGIQKAHIPSDLVTASGSGQDPNISVEGALVQVVRIAKARGIPENTLQQLVQHHVENPLFGLFGTKKINVLKLNIALDNLK